MTLDDIKKALEGFQKSDEVTQSIESLLKEQTDAAARAASQKANNEARNIRERYKGKWKEAFELDPDADDFDEKIEEFKTKLAAGTKKPTESPEYAALKKQLDGITKALETANKEKAETVAKARRKDAESKVLAALAAGKAIKPNILLPTLMGSISIPDTDGAEPVFKNGDEEIPITKGIEKFLTENPEFRSNSGTPGGDSSGDKGGAGSPNQTDIQKRRDALRGLTTPKL